MESVESLLTNDEAEFVRHVFCNPGGKYPGGPEFWDRIDMDCGVWVKPESLGLVRSVGTYKWEPTELLKLCRVQTERLGRCEACSKELFEGDEVLSFADGPIICATHNKAKPPLQQPRTRQVSAVVFSGG